MSRIMGQVFAHSHERTETHWYLFSAPGEARGNEALCLCVRNYFFRFLCSDCLGSLSPQPQPWSRVTYHVFTALSHFTKALLRISSAPPVSACAQWQSHSHIWVVVMVSTPDAKLLTTLLPDEFVYSSCILGPTCEQEVWRAWNSGLHSGA